MTNIEVDSHFHTEVILRHAHGSQFYWHDREQLWLAPFAWIGAAVKSTVAQFVPNSAHLHFCFCNPGDRDLVLVSEILAERILRARMVYQWHTLSVPTFSDVDVYRCNCAVSAPLDVSTIEMRYEERTMWLQVETEGTSRLVGPTTGFSGGYNPGNMESTYKHVERFVRGSNALSSRTGRLIELFIKSQRLEHQGFEEERFLLCFKILESFIDKLRERFPIEVATVCRSLTGAAKWNPKVKLSLSKIGYIPCTRTTPYLQELRSIRDNISAHWNWTEEPDNWSVPRLAVHLMEQIALHIIRWEIENDLAMSGEGATI